MGGFWENDPIVDSPVPSAKQGAGFWVNDKVVDTPQQSGGIGSALADAGRFGMTAVTRGLGNLADNLPDPMSAIRRLIDPRLEHIEQSMRPHPGAVAGDAVFNATGIPEYVPTSDFGRVGMATAQGGIGGLPFGPAGAVIGAASGAAGQGTQELTGNERMATAASLTPGVVAGAWSALGQKPPVPTAQELKKAAGAGYDAARNSGVEYHGNAVADMASNIRAGLDADGLFDVLAPKTHTILDKATNPPTGAVSTVANLQSLRQSLGFIAREISEGKPTQDALAATRALRGLDGFMERADPAAIAAGTPQDAAALSDTLRTANANYGAANRSNDLTGTLDRANTGILERADARAQAANSGRNLDNTIRQKIASLLEKPRAIHGFSDEEIAALNAVLEGGPVRNTARYVGNLLGGGGGLGQAVTAGLGAAGGAAAGGGVGAAIGAVAPTVVGAGAKSLANSLAKRSLQAADETVRMNSPLYETMPMPSRETAVLRSLLPGITGESAATNAPDKAANNTVYALARMLASGDTAKAAQAQKSAQRLPQAQRDALAQVLSSWGMAPTP